MELINGLLDVALVALLVVGQYIHSKKITKLNIEIDFLYSSLEQLELRVIQNEKKGKK